MVLKLTENKEFLEIVSCTQLEYQQLLVSYTKYAKNYRFHPKFKNGTWDGKISFIKGKYIPASTYMYLHEVCKEFGFTCSVEGLESIYDINLSFEDFNNWCVSFFEDLKFKPRWYQIEAAYKMIKAKRCMGSLATSAGKTLITYIIFAYLLDVIQIKKKILMVVPSVSLVLQSSGDIMEYNTDKLPLKIQQVYSGAKYSDDTNIVVGTFQSLVKESQEYFDQFDCILIDETHKCTCTSIQKIVNLCRPEYRFGLSGTIPTTKSADGLTLVSSLGPVVINVTAKELQEEGFISNCKITQVRLDYTSEELKDAFKDAKKQLVAIGKGGDMYDKECDYVTKSEKRFEALMKLISAMDSNTMVLFQHIELGTKIFHWLKENTNKQIFYIDGETDKKVRMEYKKRMENRKDAVLVASFGTSSTGLSIDSIFNVFFTESFKSPTVVLQSIGRGLRKNVSKGKDFVRIFDITDNLYKGSYLMKHAYDRINLYKSQQFPYEVKDVKL